MKKTREVWWFLIPFVLLTAWSLFGRLLLHWLFGDAVPLLDGPVFIGGEYYLELMLSDPTVWLAAVRTLVGDWLGAAAIGAVLGAVVFLLLRRIPLSRPWRYAVVFAAATLITLGVWVAQVRLVPNGYNWLYFLQTGNAATFFVWLAECVWTAVKKPKREVETE